MRYRDSSGKGGRETDGEAGARGEIQRNHEEIMELTSKAARLCILSSAHLQRFCLLLLVTGEPTEPRGL